jgi:hypothetical protein
MYLRMRHVHQACVQARPHALAWSLPHLRAWSAGAESIIGAHKAPAVAHIVPHAMRLRTYTSKQQQAVHELSAAAARACCVHERAGCSPANVILVMSICRTRCARCAGKARALHQQPRCLRNLEHQESTAQAHKQLQPQQQGVCMHAQQH